MNNKTKFPRKNGRAWCIATLVFWFIFLFFSTVIAVNEEDGGFFVIPLIGFMAHCLTFMRKRPIPLVASVLIGLQNVAIMVVIIIVAAVDMHHDWDIALLFSVISIVPIICYGLHVFAPRYFSSFVGMSWEETKRTAEITPNAIQRKLHLRAREKAYAQIDKYHDYLQRGVITQEEYEDNRRRILETLGE